MRYNIICAGTGGQGVVTAARILADAAVGRGYVIRQSEVHGMARRGGSVSVQLRIADATIESDLIPRGAAHLIIGMEPLEGLRFLPWLEPDGAVVVSLDEVNDFTGYPTVDYLVRELGRVPRSVTVHARKEASAAEAPRAANMLLLGIASRIIPMLRGAAFEDSIREHFREKGEDEIRANLRAFAAGIERTV
jgi:indolepyruvate ferredoxin oxidoreductase beta subunit